MIQKVRKLRCVASTATKEAKKSEKKCVQFEMAMELETYSARKEQKQKSLRERIDITKWNNICCRWRLVKCKNKLSTENNLSKLHAS